MSAADTNLVHINGIGELACLLSMAADLADRANNYGDMGAVWRLAALLRAAKARADELHDGAASALMAEGMQA